jgi:REP element-mobilizing transposase RayT
MTAPRQVLEGSCYLVTRRCLERRFFLRPSPRTTAAFRYLLAVAASRHGIRVHAFCVLSNHVHLVVSDPHAKLPLFHRDLDGLVARSVNSALGRWESFWAPGSYSAVRLETPAAILEKILYVLANPVAAGLVRRGRDWPGLWSEPGLFGAGPIPVARPPEFFRPRGRMPHQAFLELVPPPGFDDAPGFVVMIQRLLLETEDREAARLGREGRSFLGVARVLAQRPAESPTTSEPRRRLNPRIASRDKWKRVEALARLAEFAGAYREALAAWMAGARETVFPAGTWLLRVHHGVRCAAAG